MDRQWIALRGLNVAVGGWVLASAFLWPHQGPEQVNAIIVGAGCAVSALLAIWLPRFRYLNAALGLWLFCSWVPLAPARMGTVYNDWVFGIFMLLVALGVPWVPTGDAWDRARTA